MKLEVFVITMCEDARTAWAQQPVHVLVPWRQGFRHPTRNECMGSFAQIMLLHTLYGGTFTSINCLSAFNTKSDQTESPFQIWDWDLNPTQCESSFKFPSILYINRCNTRNMLDVSSAWWLSFHLRFCE